MLSDDDIARLVAPLPFRWRQIGANRVRQARDAGYSEIELRRPPNHRPPCADDIWGIPAGCDSPCPLPPVREGHPLAEQPDRPDPIDLLPAADRPAVRRWVRYAEGPLGLDDVGPWDWLGGPVRAEDWCGLRGDGRPLFYADAPVPEGWGES